MDKLPVSEAAEALVVVLTDAYNIGTLAQVLGRAEQIAQEQGAAALERRHIYAALQEFGKENGNE